MLFESVYHALMQTNAQMKVQAVKELYQNLLEDRLILEMDFPIAAQIEAGIPKNVTLVDPKYLPRRKVHTDEGKAAMIHAILHIEFNAINLALDAAYRFRNMPFEYYANWLKVAREEAYHFCLLEQHLHHLGYHYGSFVAHQGLWEMAQKTGYDVLVRMALVPRLLEARGLDVTPMLATKLSQVGDNIASEILAIIFHDEIGHVAIGNHWFSYLCQLRNLSPMETFISLLKQHAPTYLRGPFSLETRRKAGFGEQELEYFSNLMISS